VEWTRDVSAGDWLREAIDPTGPAWGATMHASVPRGFPAYARIFHPATRDRPVGQAWPLLPYERNRREWDAFRAAAPQIDVEQVTWGQAADAFGTTMHAGAQWQRLVSSREGGGEDGPRDAEGWRYSEPPLGQLRPDLVSAAVTALLPATSTPDDGFVALWEGWGGLVGHVGYGPSRVLLTGVDDRGSDDAGAVRHGSFLATSTRDRFNDVFRRPSWQPGVLSDDVSRGARLTLPARDHVLFAGALSDLADPEWPWNVPWRDVDDAAVEAPLGAEPATVSPSILWPADRAWVLVSDVDLDSSFVAGSPDAIRAICSDPRLEALRVDEGLAVTWDSDEVNRE
jgi:hypothetical protein